MAKQKIETSIEINGIDVVAYPLVESDHVTFENGMSINEMIKGDVSTPVVTHEEISFKVGKGDSDVSSSIVDSSVGEMIIKGQTYQNILPEPSLRNSMSNGKTMQKFNEGYDNVNVVDGVGKSVILKGQTLTNIHKLVRPILEAETPSNYAITKNSVGEISFDVLVSEHKKWRYINAGFLNISLLKPNTKYLVVFEESQNITWVKFMSGNALNAISESGKVQNNRAIVTTLNQITDNRQILYLTFEDGTPNTKVSSKNPMIIEYQDGMENWDIPYFEGMKSVESPVLKTTSLNILPQSDFKKMNSLGDWKILRHFDEEVQPLNHYKFDFSQDSGLTITKLEGAYPFPVLASPLVEVETGEKLYVSSKNPNTSHAIFIKCYDDSMNKIVPLEGLNYGDDIYISYNSLCKHFANNNLFELMIADSRIKYIQWSSILTDRSTYTFNEIMISKSPITTATTYEPHKSNTLTTPLDLTLRGIGNVYDTLDFVSGEKVECIGEIVLDGSEEEKWVLPVAQHGDNTYLTYIRLSDAKPQQGKLTVIDKLPYLPVPSGDLWYPVADIETYRINHNRDLLIRWNKTRFSKAINSVSDFKEYLRTNPITVQYQLETPIVKTIDLISSGNWEKVVLDGSEDWFNGDSSWRNRLFGTLKSDIYINFNSVGSPNVFSDSLRSSVMNELCNGSTLKTGISNFNDSIFVSMEGINSIAELQSYLRANPITVWYQTATHKDSTQVKQPLSFSNGHVQLSSKEGSLIPSLDYEVPTSNSYHMDLMKTDTNYTVKSTNPSGMCDIGDVKGITIPSNYLWNVPSARKGDMLLVVHGSWTNPMILEGDVTDKAIPYFKGVKSAFEGEDKIEVLSVGKNLWSDSYFKPHSTVTISGRECIAFSSVSCQNMPLDNPFFVNKDKYYRISGEFVKTKSDGKNQYFGITIQINGAIYGYPNAVLYVLGNGTQPLNQFYRDGVTLKFPESGWVTSLSVVNYGSVNLRDINVVAGTLLMEELNSTSNNGDVYVKHKSNITKIPLSSPLRSLPNGVCDEVILDRENNKVKVIQRVGYEVFDGSENWQRDSFNFANRNFLRFITFLTNVKTNGKGLCDKLPVLEGDKFGVNYIRPSIDRTWIYKADLTVTTDSLVRELSTDPLTLYYELATPIITEIDLDGYPYIYKDGHIFLNSEIAPTTTMKYSINQSHQIESQNGDLIRHEKEINYLYTLIAKYVNVQYESTLLNLDLELSRA